MEFIDDPSENCAFSEEALIELAESQEILESLDSARDILENEFDETESEYDEEYQELDGEIHIPSFETEW